MPVRFDEIDQIEMLHGPGSSVWGGDALTAVVNMRTKSPREMRGGLADGVGGERGTRSMSGRWAGARDAWSYKVSGSYYRQGPWERPATLPDGSPMPVDFAYDNPPTPTAAVRRADRLGSVTTPAGGRSGPAMRARPDRCSRRPCRWSSSSCYSVLRGRQLLAPGLDATLQFRRLVGHAISVLDGSPSDAVSNTPSADVTFRRVIGTRQALVFGGSTRADFFEIAAAPNQRRAISGRRVRGRPDRATRRAAAESRRPARLHPDRRRGVLAARERGVAAHDQHVVSLRVQPRVPAADPHRELPARASRHSISISASASR